jgi:hypothetical protein
MKPPRTFSLRSVDDAGNPVRIFDGPGFASWRTSSDARVKDLIRRTSFVMTDRRRRFADPESFLFALPAFIMLAGILVHQQYRSVPIWAIIAPGVLLGVPGVHFAVRRSIARRADQLSRLMLEEGLCPSCGYNFHGLDRPAERFHCPECGAAWKSARVLRTLPIDESHTGSPLAAAFRQTADIATKGYEDDRGVRVPMADPRLRNARRRAAGGAPAHAVSTAAARRDLARIGRVTRALVAGVCVLVAIGFLAATLSLGARSRAAGLPVTPGSLFILVGPVAMLILAASVWFGKGAYTPRRVRQTLLAHRLCASCAAPLGHLALDPADGCIVCETCRAAWRLP